MATDGTLFPHKRTRTTTWVSLNHITENHIDRVCINKKRTEEAMISTSQEVLGHKKRQNNELIPENSLGKTQ